MNYTNHILKNVEDTAKLATSVSKEFKPGLIIFLQGDLGAGKTTFVRLILKALNYHEKVKSPTYNLVETHQVGQFTINHFDLYRFGSPEEWYSGGFDEYLQSKNTITIIDWPEKISGLLITPDIHINIIVNNDQREVSIESHAQLNICSN